jgi:drug/metabolite transporter (DMT)-like permease
MDYGHSSPSSSDRLILIGDLLMIAAAIFWGGLTLYIKKYLAPNVHPINTFLYQLVFSIPVLFILAYILETKWILNLNLPIMGSVFYQSVIVAFVSYLVWFKLIHEYPITRLTVFTFLTPVFGVIFGVLFLGDHPTAGLIGGLLNRSSPGEIVLFPHNH